MIIHGTEVTHGVCQCARCDALTVAPVMPALRLLPDGRDLWTVDCHWMSGLVGGRAVLIRRGFETDGASVPRLFWRMIGHPFMGDLLPHALPHDGLYAAELMSRADCDAWFLESMAAGGLNVARRNAIWAAVRVGGGAVWAGHDRKSVEHAAARCRLVGEEEWHALAARGRLAA